MNISFKNSLISSLVLTVSLGTVSFLGYEKAKQYIESNFENEASQQIKQIQTEVDMWIKDKQEIFTSLAETDELKTGNIQKSIDLSARLSERNKNPDAFAFIEANGNLHLPGAPGPIPVGNYPHFQAAMKGQTITIDPVASKSPSAAGAPIVLTATPVYDYSGKIIGVSNGGNPIQELIDIISKVKLGQSGHAMVFTKDGTIVAGEHKKDTLTKNMKDLKSKELNQIVKEAVNGKAGMKEITMENTKYLVFYTHTSKVNWGVMIMIPTNEAYAQANDLLKYFIMTTIVFLLLSICVSYFGIRKTLKPLFLINKKLEGLAKNEGDLTARLEIQTKDEIGELSNNFNLMIENMQSLIENITQKGKVISRSSNDLLLSVEEISSASKQVSESIANSSQSAENQGNKANQNLELLEEINENIHQITGNSSTVSKEAKHILQEAKDGNCQVTDLKSQMDVIQEKVNQSTDFVQKLDEKFKEIETILDFILAISANTKMLSLNASIEAARAGEHGKGFMIVADEVKKLSEQSALSSSQITELINEIKLESTKAVKSLHESLEEVKEGSTQSNGVGELFQKISLSTDKMATQIEMNFHSTEDLYERTKEMEENMKNSMELAEEVIAYSHDVFAASEEQVSSNENIKKATEGLSELSHDLEKLLSKFKI